VKYVLPALAVLILGISIQTRMSRKGVDQPLMPSRELVRTESVVAPTEVRSRPVRSEPDFQMTGNRRESTVQNGTPRASTEPAASEMVQEMLEGMADLELSEEQAAGILPILRDRAEELGRWHQEIRESGVFNPGEYGRSLTQRRELWFRRIDGLLDARQHEGFRQLVSLKGFLRQGTDFTVYQNELTVIR
jgi:hypothetical protein